MSHIDLTSPSCVKAILRSHEIRPKKHLGQNFLIDRSVLDKIVDALSIQEGDPVLEIGPGVGALTLALADKGANVVAVEIDQDMVTILSDITASYPNVTVISQDFLRLSLPQFLAEHFGDRPVKVVGNLPYYITTPIIEKLLTVGNKIERIVMMIQAEVAERLAAVPGGSEFGALSVFIQYHTEPELVARVPNTAFLPPPEVKSAVVRLIPREHPPVNIPSEKLFFDVVHSAFGKKRKMLSNSLAECPPLNIPKEDVSKILSDAQVDPTRRAQTLSLEEFARIARLVAQIR